MMDKMWLVADEILMLTMTMTAHASQIAGKVRGEHVDSMVPFRGLNVILFWDFHQFPPPAKIAQCLYGKDCSEMIATLGKSIYLQF
jgi:hypothetical protein